MLPAVEPLSTAAEVGPGLLRNTARLSQPKVDPSADAGDLHMQDLLFSLTLEKTSVYTHECETIAFSGHFFVISC